MMQSFRNAAKPVIILVTVSFLVWLIWDLSGLGSGTGGIFAARSVGKINGQSVDIRVFDQQVQNVTQDQQQRGAQLGLDQIQEIRNQVWDQTVQAALLRDEYAKRGLTVSSDELADAIRNVPLPDLQQVPTFQTNGQFDLEKYQRWLASAEGQLYVPGLEAQYRDQLLQAKLFRSVTADVFVSDASLWERFTDEKEQVRIGLVRIDPAANVARSAPPSDAELQAYYNEHQAEFKRGRSAFLSYVSLSRATNAVDTATALARAQSIRAEIMAGAPFEELAARESADSGSAAQGGALGELARSGVVPEFGDAAMSLPLNTVSEPVLSPFGYHLIKVEARSGDKFTARHVLVPIEVAGVHRDELDAVADSLENLAAERLDGTALDTAASAMRLTVRQVGPVVEGTRVFLPDAGQIPDAGAWAFQAEAKEHSSVIETPNAFYVFRLDSLVKEGVPAFASVKAEVEAKVRMQKQVVEARRMAETVSKQVQAGARLSDASRTLGLSYQELGPFARLTAPLGSPVLIGTSFSLKAAQVSRPVEPEPENGDQAIYLIEALQRLPADSAEFVRDLQDIRQQALQAARRSRVQSYLAYLRESATIVDRRSDIYKTAAQNAAALAAAQAPIQ